MREADDLTMSNVIKIWEPKPPGTLRVTPGLLRDSFTFYLQQRAHSHEACSQRLVHVGSTELRAETLTVQNNLSPTLSQILTYFKTRIPYFT